MHRVMQLARGYKMVNPSGRIDIAQVQNMLHALRYDVEHRSDDSVNGESVDSLLYPLSMYAEAIESAQKRVQRLTPHRMLALT